MRPLHFSVSLLLWMGFFAFWYVVSRNHHPTPTIDALATAILVSASAACFYIHDRILRPRLLSQSSDRNSISRSGLKRAGTYLIFLTLTVAVLDLAAVVLIQAIYDQLWGPDPLRFGFWKNVLLEAVFITVHLAIAVAAVSGLRFFQRARARA